MIGQAAREAAAHNRPSHIAGDDLTFLMALDPVDRRTVLTGLPGDEMTEVLRASRRSLGTAYGLWQDDPVGFVEQVLGETLWSRQRRILTALPEYKRVIVPSAVGMGKTHIAARGVAWNACCWPVGTT